MQGGASVGHQPLPLPQQATPASPVGACAPPNTCIPLRNCFSCSVPSLLPLPKDNVEHQLDEAFDNIAAATGDLEKPTIPIPGMDYDFAEHMESGEGHAER